jgi:hypothetical protein
MIPRQWNVRGCLKQKSDIKMVMCGLTWAGWDSMNINIKNPVTDDCQLMGRQPRFFLCFSHGNLKDIGLAIGMPSRLKPAVEFLMMQQNCVRSVW